jgi:hypothetical protein
MANISYSRISFFIIAFSISGVSCVYFGDELRVSEKPSEYIGVTFSILAASLFAVVSIVGDPSMLLPGNWRVGWESVKSIQIELQRLNFLFVWYLVTLGLLVATEIIDHAKWTNAYFVFNIFAFFATFGFLISLGLPFELARIQRNRLQHEINQRKGRP